MITKEEWLALRPGDEVHWDDVYMVAVRWEGERLAYTYHREDGHLIGSHEGKWEETRKEWQVAAVVHPLDPHKSLSEVETRLKEEHYG